MNVTKKSLIFFITLLISIPLVTYAASLKKHIPITDEQQCSDCHIEQQQAWQSGKHGEFLVQCVVCHGSLDATFFVKPPMDRCNSCHADMVADLQKRKSSRLTCTSCHDKHTLAVKTKIPFHKKGDK
jgi:hypothetical protein